MKKIRNRLSVGKFWKGFIVLTKTFEEGCLSREIKEIEWVNLIKAFSSKRKNVAVSKLSLRNAKSWKQIGSRWFSPTWSNYWKSLSYYFELWLASFKSSQYYTKFNHLFYKKSHAIVFKTNCLRLKNQNWNWIVLNLPVTLKSPFLFTMEFLFSWYNYIYSP